MFDVKINKNVNHLKESATLAINLKAKAMLKEGKTVYHWGFGQSPFPVPECIQQELKMRSAHKEYLPTNGLPELRATLREFYQKNYSLNYPIENIFIGPGSKELIFQLIYLLEAEFFIPAPSWVSYGPQVNLKGHSPNIIYTQIKQNYKITPPLLNEALNRYKDKQKVLILNSPSNPTGQFYNDQELADLAKVLKQHKVIVISDEIYHQVNFESEITPSLAQYYPEGTIITGGLSKAQAAGGYRVGYITIPPELNSILTPLKSMISETFSAVSAPIQYAAIKGWDGNRELKNFLMKTVQIHKTIGHYYFDRFIKMKIKTPTPQGAFYLFIDFSEYKTQFEKININTGLQLAKWLLDEVNIALLPGEDFYFPSDSLSARIAYVDYNGEEMLNKLPENFTIEDILKIEPKIKEGLDQLESALLAL